MLSGIKPRSLIHASIYFTTEIHSLVLRQHFKATSFKLDSSDPLRNLWIIIVILLVYLGLFFSLKAEPGGIKGVAWGSGSARDQTHVSLMQGKCLTTESYFILFTHFIYLFFLYIWGSG